MVESTALEMRHGGNSIGGSNPSLSASGFFTLPPIPSQDAVFVAYSLTDLPINQGLRRGESQKCIVKCTVRCIVQGATDIRVVASKTALRKFARSLPHKERQHHSVPNASTEKRHPPERLYCQDQPWRAITPGSPRNSR